MKAATAWPRPGRWWLLVGQVACLATIAAAGRASAERATTGGQSAWLAVAVAAAVISAAGNGVWLGTVRRATNTRRRLLATRLAASQSFSRPDATVHDVSRHHGRGPVGETRPEAGGGLVMVPGLTRRHRPGCALVAGRSVVPATADTRPCGWCSDE